MMKPSPHCIRCGKRPDELSEYVDAAADLGVTPDAYVRSEEGTYNSERDLFVCTDCYIAMGMPTRLDGWRAGDE